jgi:hypothetical protein
MKKYIEGNVDISNLYLQRIPDFLSDVEISGHFFCNINNLVSLEGLPPIIGGLFNCSHNKRLTSLKGLKSTVITDGIQCAGCGLKSLEGAPTSIGGGFFAAGNQLKSLELGPTSVVGFYDVNNNPLKTLVGAPTQIGTSEKKGYFMCERTKIKSLVGAPTVVYGDFSVTENELTSLEGIPKLVTGVFDISGNKGRTFTRKEILAVCEVGGKIFR